MARSKPSHTTPQRTSSVYIIQTNNKNSRHFAVWGALGLFQSAHASRRVFFFLVLFVCFSTLLLQRVVAKFEKKHTFWDSKHTDLGGDVDRSQPAHANCFFFIKKNKSSRTCRYGTPCVRAYFHDFLTTTLKSSFRLERNDDLISAGPPLTHRIFYFFTTDRDKVTSAREGDQTIEMR